jgi:hypothetical protein
MKRIKQTVLLLFLCVLFLSPAFAFSQPVLPDIPSVQTYGELVSAIRLTQTEARARTRQDINREKVREAWEIGRLIHEHVFLNKERADYGTRLLLRLSEDTGIAYVYYRYASQFYLTYREGPPDYPLTLSHYRMLLSINDPEKREALTKSALENGWTVQETLAQVKKIKRLSRAGNPETLAEVIPGKPGVYRIVSRPGLPSAGLMIDLGFDIYYDLPEEYAGKFKNGDIVEGQSPGGLSVRDVKISTDGTKTTGSEYLSTYKAHVTRVVDGDTFYARIDLGFGMHLEQRLRLRRLDAPELESADGEEAKAVLRKKLPPDIIIKVSKSDDQYGRYLVDVFTPELASIDQKLLDSGLFTVR